MPLFLGHATAELVLDKPWVESLSPAADQMLEHCAASRIELSRLDLQPLEGIPLPYDVLVSSPQEARTWGGVRCHLCRAPLPLGSFLEISPELFVASPALTFVQRAAKLSLAQTVALGARLCGTFALDRDSGSGVRERAPLVTPDDLQLYVNHCQHVNGIKRARRTLPLILPNAASPMEAITALVYCLPPRHGGFGFPVPQLNYEQTLRPSAQRLVGKDCIRIDIYWSDHQFGLEYQGKFAHSSHTSIAADIARQLAAEQMGIELQMLTIEQIRDQGQRLAIARKIACRLGAQIPAGRTFLVANQRLVDELLCSLPT